MSTLQEVKGKVDQIAPTILKEGQIENIAMSKIGQLFTVDWVTRLAMAGRVYSMPLGLTGGETTYSPLTGNVAVDNNQPEVVIAIDTGWLIPIEIDINIGVDDMKAYGEIVNILFIGDRSQTVAAGETGNVVTAVNLLDGGDAFSGRCYDTIASNIPNPVTSDLLGFKFWELTQLAGEAAGKSPPTKNYHKKFEVPRFLAGPCSIIGTVTSSNSPKYFGSVVFAHLPVSWITIS